MRHRIIAVLVLLLLLLVPGRTAFAQDDAIEDVRKAFANLRTSIVNSRGVRNDAVGAIRAFRDRVEGLRAQYPIDPSLIAIEIQLSVWLKEHDRVGAGFRKLVEVTGDFETYGGAWLDYVRPLRDPVLLDEVYAYLTEGSDDSTWALQWADMLVAKGDFTKALELLQSVEIDPATAVGSAVSLADCLLAEEQFAAAAAAIDAIPEETLAASDFQRDRADLIRRHASEYEEAWSLEQTQRMTDATANLPRARFETSRGSIIVELFEDQAPNTVANFIKLTDQGQYDGTKIHDTTPGSRVEGGDPVSRNEGVVAGATAPGSSNPGYYIADEHATDAARKHFAGSLAMLNRGLPDTGGCLWSLTLRPAPERDGKYTVFGRIVQGLDVARILEEDDVIEKITITGRRDHPYEPETLALPAGITQPAAAPDDTGDPSGDSSIEPPADPPAAGGG